MTISKDIIPLIDVSTRSKRRETTSFVIGLLEHIRFAEEANIGRFPPNLQNSTGFAKADYSWDRLVQAIIALGDAY